MDFEWDQAKAAANFAKHRVSFSTAAEVFEDEHLLIEPDRDTEGELRELALGQSRAGILFVVFTERDEEVIRIISARRATKHEQRRYLDQI